MKYKLAGKIAIVTGAGQGIGRAIATKLASEGAAVLANDLDEDALAETITSIEHNGGRAAALAREWGRLGITVNAVAFGPIETRLIGEFEEEPGQIDIKGQQHRVGLSREQREQIAASASLGRLGTVAEAAGAVYLLCIPESDYVTGQVLVCAGGATV